MPESRASLWLTKSSVFSKGQLNIATKVYELTLD